MTPADPPPVSPPLSITPPPLVRVAALIAIGEAVAIVVLAAAVILRRQDADLTWAAVTASYFLVLALLIAAVSRGLLQGRRWARTPAIVVQLIVALCGFYLAVPSGQPLPGVAVLVVGAVPLVLLLSPAANAWIKQFPPLYGPTPDR